MVSVLFVALGREIGAQSATHPTSADYVGTYADTPGHPVEILSEGEFFAVQDEAKYPLIAKGVDAFSTMYGPTLSFKRDAGGTVTGFQRPSPQSRPRLPSRGLKGKIHLRSIAMLRLLIATTALPSETSKTLPSESRQPMQLCTRS
jgi:hypothetical protein